MVGNRSALGWLNLIMPKERGVRRIATDIVFGPKARHRLDIYAPAEIRQPLPAIVFYYGGGWDSGEKAEYGFVGAALAALGHVVVIPDYRVFPDAIYPDFLDDCAGAADWVTRHIADYGGDPGLLILAGHSAGAYNAVMVAADKRLTRGRRYGHAVKAVVGLSGPYDFFPYDVDVSKRSFGGAGAGAESQPVNLDLSGAPPMFLAHGTGDKTVRLRNTVALAAALRAAGRAVDEVHYPNASHAGTLLGMMTVLRWRLPLLRDLRAFLQSVSSHATCEADRDAV